MNTKNNKRRRESIEKINRAFIELLQNHELKEISVSDICKLSELNRSTFYANFLDIYDLADKMRKTIEDDFSALFEGDENYEQNGALKMFTHIYENQILYKTYFRLEHDKNNQIMVYDLKRAEQDFDNKHLKYHIEFFRNGINAIIKMWLNDGCKETPEQMHEILKQEYKGR